MTCADDADGMSMSIGQYVTSKDSKYTIIEQIGKGGYGAVYRVSNNEGKEFALKAEKKIERREHTKLNMELHILKQMENQPEEKSHYARIYDRAKKNKYYMMVMTLLGESLSDLKKRRHPAVFRLNTGYAAALQCLEAVEELHKIGFIHRDIKPGNYAVGLGRRSSTIYILDFGISRRTLNEKGEIKTPRVRVPFKGTVRFAPIATHQNCELSYKDDCESWIYMVSDMCNPRGVPWKMEKDKDRVMESKKLTKTPKGKERLFYGMSVEEFGQALDYIAGLHYTEKVDYNFIYGLVIKAARHKNLSLKPPYDWERNSSETDETPSTDSNAPHSHEQPGSSS